LAFSPQAEVTPQRQKPLFHTATSRLSTDRGADDDGARCRRNLASLYAHVGRIVEADSAYRRSITMFNRRRDPLQEAWTRYLLHNS
jgi:Flp pilus assembly protein TadD